MMSLELNQSDLNRLIAFAKALSVAAEDDDEDKVSNVLFEFKEWAEELGLVSYYISPPDHNESGWLPGFMKQSDLGKLIAIAKELSVAAEDEVYSVLFGLKEWAQEIGLVSLWSVYCKRDGTTTPIGSWCIADGEDVMDYVRSRAIDHDEWWSGDKLLIYRNRSFPPDEPSFVIPLQDQKRKSEVDWQHEGF